MRFARAFAFVACLVSCSDAAAPPAATCPNDLPGSCPSAPSYMNEVAPIVTAKCLPCHQTGANQQRPLDTYTTLTVDRDSVRTQFLVCQMPPAGSPQLTEAERHTLLQWLVCAAPNN